MTRVTSNSFFLRKDEEVIQKPGSDLHPHVTIRTGIPDDSFINEEFKALMEKQTPFEVKITGLSLWESKGYAILVFNIQKSKSLTDLRNIVSQFATKKNNFFNPHCTISFLKTSHSVNLEKLQKSFLEDVEEPILINSIEMVSRTGDITLTKFYG